ncbi:hypothetical protein L599_000100000750 [Luteimonas sp. J16]|jgi:hypothetical protein|uniref:DUF4124 domain-containing protein n=1 Tax=unclassified Luteimonas TaxID=2629088 RepID=UPI0004790F13|nr:MULTISPECIES: DUF4124 domain-containing protein [unclassified Luteimonas]TWG94359.1 hypothetical protein L599_000100000750 [Luteimonas sp. J16]
MIRRTTCALLLLTSALGAGPVAHAQVRRCTTDDGRHVYTDRQCADVGASERVSPLGPAGSTGAPLRRDCARRLQDLVFELTAAIDSRDVNRLAGIYHWPGMSSSAGYAVMSRLDAIVNRPLVDITPLHPQPPPPPEPVPAAGPAPASGWVELPSGVRVWRTLPRPTDREDASHPDAMAGDSSVREPTAAAPGPPPPRLSGPPTALVVDQTAPNRVTPMQTVFSLRRHLGCWWLSL